MPSSTNSVMSRLVLATLLVFCGLFGTTPGAAATATSLRQRSLLTNTTLIESKKIEKEKAAIVIGGVAGATLAIAAPAVLVALYLEDNIHRIPAAIELILPEAVDIREPSVTEALDLEVATTGFYNDILEAVDGFETLVLARERIWKFGDPTFLTGILDTLTGNDDRIYGFRYTFDFLVQVDDADDTTLGDILTPILAADMTAYLAVINALEVNIFAEATEATFTDKVRGW